MNVHARDIAGDIGKVLKAGIRYELPGHDAERLWNVDQGRVDLRRRRRAVRIDALRPRARILCPAGGPRRRNPRSSVLRDWRWCILWRLRAALCRPRRRRCGARLRARRLEGDLRQRCCVRLL